ncbi:hypothetical protein [Salinarimonas sp.]|uniref:hypothetical protein n=1 Tax=Salinarimonas sp. TaxID=2766526 RepID=UPI0032D8EBF6
MTKLALATAAAAALFAGSALAAPSEVTLYDAPQQKDAFFQLQRGAAPDVNVTGSIATPAPVVADEVPFWAAHEQIRIDAQNNS